jgi:hypothetical protein
VRRGVTRRGLHGQAQLAGRVGERAAPGEVDPARALPKNSGFGAATGAQTRGAEAGLGNNCNRVMMLQIRFQF